MQYCLHRRLKGEYFHLDVIYYISGGPIQTKDKNASCTWKQWNASLILHSGSSVGGAYIPAVFVCEGGTFLERDARFRRPRCVNLLGLCCASQTAPPGRCRPAGSDGSKALWDVWDELTAAAGGGGGVSSQGGSVSAPYARSAVDGLRRQLLPSTDLWP